MNPSELILSAGDATDKALEQQLEKLEITAEIETAETEAKMASLNEGVKDVVAQADIDGDHAEELDLNTKAEGEQLDGADTDGKTAAMDKEIEETPSEEKNDCADDLVENDVDKEHDGQEELKEDPTGNEAAVPAKEDDEKTSDE